MRRLIEQGLCVVTLIAGLSACSSEQQGGPATKQDSGLESPPDGGTAPDEIGGDDSQRPGTARDNGSLPPSAAEKLVSEQAEPCVYGCQPVISPLRRAVSTEQSAPPALSGGTLLATRDGKWLVAADPDRDRIYFVDVAQQKLSHARELTAGAEPGRLIEDDEGRIHVALRGRGALLTLTVAPDSQMTERVVCSQARGLAYDAARDSVHLACADGKLVSIAAAPDGAVSRTLELGRDLRDVLVRGDELWVTRFRSAELLHIDAEGTVVATMQPPSLLVRGSFDPTTETDPGYVAHTPNVAWRAIDIPGKGSALLHQRSRVTEVTLTVGGYGSQTCQGVVQTSLTVGLDAERQASVDLADTTLAIDMAADPTGTLLAVASPGNWGSAAQLTLYSLTGMSPLNPRAPAQEMVRIVQRGVFRFDAEEGAALPLHVCVAPQTRYPSPDGQVTSVTFLARDRVAMFTREPATISLLDVPSGRALARIELEQASRFDTGYAIFHMRTQSGIACASCHAEAGDDGHVWLFRTIGSRRTQSLRGGILGSEPFHWDGDMKDFDALVNEVFVKRMGVVEPPSAEQTDALAHWIDAMPLWAATPNDPEQVERGKALFETPAVGCASCHAGALLTDNRSVDVGTGALLQVPALRGVSFRLPVMHDGCAHTLRQRFDVTCGGDRHGDTTMLSEAQLSDLIAYLETL